MWTNEVSGMLNRKQTIVGKGILVLSIILALFSISEAAETPSQGASGSVFDPPPFPFSDKSLEEEMEESRFSSEVPIPLDTIAEIGKAEGYVPDLYGRTAPKPERNLRPRYRSQVKKSSPTKVSTTDSDKPEPIEPVASSQHIESTTQPPKDQKIRQVSGSQAFPTTVTPPPIVRSEYEEAPFPSHEGKFLAEPAGFFSPEPSTINNTHTCDGWTCGEGCSSGGFFQHLDDRKPRRGLCRCCGLLTCSKKTAGPWFFDGWVNVGSFMNTHWPDDRNNRPMLYNDRNGEVVMNQLYLSFGRRVDTRKNRWDLGGRVDLLYGTDYFYTSSLGLETRRTHYWGGPAVDPLNAVGHWNSNKGWRRDGTASLYGLSMPQAYAEVFAPIGDGVTFRAGHFYSDMGIESAMSPANFFYSHSYSFMYGAPTMLTGATATVRLGRNLSGIVGFSQGWNTWDSPTDNIAALAGLHLKSRDERSSLSFLVHSGEESLRGSDRRTNYVLTYRQRLGSRWHYALEHTFGYEKNGSLRQLTPTTERGPARWFSIAQYLQWELTEKLSVGFRAEWFRDDGHSRIQKGAVSSDWLNLAGKDYFELTLGLNWKPTRYITIRPEIRYDWSNVRYNYTPYGGSGFSSGVYSNDTKSRMTSFAVDAIIRF